MKRGHIGSGCAGRTGVFGAIGDAGGILAGPMLAKTHEFRRAASACLAASSTDATSARLVVLASHPCAANVAYPTW